MYYILSNSSCGTFTSFPLLSVISLNLAMGSKRSTVAYCMAGAYLVEVMLSLLPWCHFILSVEQSKQTV